MAGTYSQVYLQIVFAVKERQSLLKKSFREEVFKYIAGIIKEKGQKPIIVNGFSDHVHCFLGFTTAISISDLVREIKSNSSRFINERRWVPGKFQWQEGYGVFSYGHSQIQQVYDYIQNQEQHHIKKTFREEYIEFLEKFNIKYNAEYLFDWIL